MREQTNKLINRMIYNIRDSRYLLVNENYLDKPNLMIIAQKAIYSFPLRHWQGFGNAKRLNPSNSSPKFQELVSEVVVTSGHNELLYNLIIDDCRKGFKIHSSQNKHNANKTQVKLTDSVTITGKYDATNN